MAAGVAVCREDRRNARGPGRPAECAWAGRLAPI